jgi:hypothetical protein
MCGRRKISCEKIFPVKEENFDIHDGSFSGSIDFSSLPTGIKVIDLSGNNFSGSVNFSYLPENLENLSLSGNEFSGELDLSTPCMSCDLDAVMGLPTNSMMQLTLLGLLLAGSISYQRIPPSILFSYTF